MQVKAVVGGVTTYYVGSHYQVENGVVTKYYFAGAQRVAMRKNGTLYYLLADHLGSTSLTTNTSGALVSELRYKAWGETRYSSGTTPTSYRYTGQREEPGIGLYFYNARWYDPYLNHFTQPDSIVPDPNNSQDWDRYAYARNNPVRYTDPSGHGVDCGIGMGCVKDYTGAKTLKDFRDMGWNERKHWLADIVHENDLGHWFDDMLGAIDFMAHNPSLSQQGGTAEVMDAAVLQAINDGLLITKGSDPFGGGGQGWADFFKERQDSNDEDHLIATRLRAEQQGVNYAWGLASTQSAFGNSTQSDQIFFRLFKTGADSYRSSAIAYRLGTPYSTMAVQYGAPQFTGPLVVTATGIMTDPRTSGPGLVGIGVLTWGLYDHTFGVLIK